MSFHESLVEVEDIFELLAAMNVIHNHISSRFSADVGGELSIAQFGILHFYSSRPGIRKTLNELADHFSLSKATVGDLVDKLKAKDFLVVETNENDRRSRLVSITEAGLAAHGSALAAVRPFLSEMRDGVGAETFTQARQLLQPVREWVRENK